MSFNGMIDQERPDCIILHNSGDDQDTVASIYSYHRSKWLDVGYNWLVYKGRAHVGRAMKYIGAHSKGENDGSIGVCIVGNYMDKLPKERDIQRAVKLIAEQCFIFKIDPENIIGHKDVGNTDCPGNKLYDYLPEFRKRVAEQIKKELPKKPQLKKEATDA